MLETLIDQYGEGWLLLAAGAIIGLIFGAAAYQSRFCLRAACAEVADGVLGPKLAIWLTAFFAALASVQLAILAGVLDVSNARQIAATGSLSGAILGGLVFGTGMILARGCASRLLVLSASGNLRAIVTGLVLTLTAQASLRGILSPLREDLSTLWTIPGGPDRVLFDPHEPMFFAVVALATLAFLTALWFGRQRGLTPLELGAATIVGLAVCGGWVMTYAIASASFEVVAVQSVTFTGPSADTLMALINESSIPLTFGLGLVPGVFLGAMTIALIKGEARIQRFEADLPMERYLIGGVLMGFGSMLAGGCAVGAGMTGGAIFALTAWVAVFSMWVGAVTTHTALNLAARRRSA
ncbi:putative inner membrane protein [Falsiruegeria litorea R37]|uniref:Putative inner membrane protein n=1 Tax=Falsiruegeria litorea R37 TaxID=1200284 RepID=A0A1Y5RPG3_9RHOB|nr:YeeE/YedE family protein [Falsiruegeria litorea]SLN22434.1 putative inner membrane protein [Falsiruegeria litorea R37]